MMLPVAFVGLASLVIGIVFVVALISWHPHAHDEVAPAGAVDPSTVFDWCEHVEVEIVRNAGAPGVRFERRVACTNVPTHELVGNISTYGDAGGHSAMVATYCDEHAPEGAVRVRTLAGR